MSWPLLRHAVEQIVGERPLSGRRPDPRLAGGAGHGPCRPAADRRRDAKAWARSEDATPTGCAVGDHRGRRSRPARARTSRRWSRDLRRRAGRRSPAVRSRRRTRELSGADGQRHQWGSACGRDRLLDRRAHAGRASARSRWRWSSTTASWARAAPHRDRDPAGEHGLVCGSWRSSASARSARAALPAHRRRVAGPPDLRGDREDVRAACCSAAWPVSAGQPESHQ